MRRCNVAALGLLLLFVAPLAFSIFFSLAGLFDGAAWSTLFAHPQLWPALQLSIFTGFISAAIAFATSLFIIAGLYSSRWWVKIAGLSGAMQSLPHAAMAIGLAFLIMPSGLIARFIAPFTGWTAPPPWVTTHDPYGLALIAALTLKETPFLLWVITSILNREDMRQLFAGQRAAALSLGHDAKSIWLRLYLPQLMPKLIWPIVIVFIYATSVVDMALVIGPTQPPTLATLVYADLNSEQVTSNARGAAGAWFLTMVMGVVVFAVWATSKLVLMNRYWLTTGPAERALIHLSAPSPIDNNQREKADKFAFSRAFFGMGEGARRADEGSFFSKVKFLTVIIITLAVIATLALLSFAILWPFPHLMPETFNASAWVRLWQNPAALFTSLCLATASVLVALALTLTWFESQPQSRDRLMVIFSMLALGIPSVLLGLGEYRAGLRFGLTGTRLGLFFAHLLPVTAYMFITLVGPYRSFDPRWKSSAHGLMIGFTKFFWAVKLPMLKAPVLAASAIGFAVSFGQYVPAQLMAAGRYSTLPMEAVTLTSGSNRPLTAAFALLLMVPPLLVFYACASFGKGRWKNG